MKEEVLEYGRSLSFKGRDRGRYLCPACSHTRSPAHKNQRCLSVSLEGSGVVYMCHHCGESGAFSLNERRAKPVQKKPSRVEVPAEVTDQTITEKVETWLASRGLDGLIDHDDLIINRKVYFPSNQKEEAAVGFVYRGENGEIIGIKWRSVESKQYRHEGDANHLFRGFQLDPSQPIILVEGEIDAMSYVAAGITNVASTPAGAPDKKPDEDREKDTFKYLTHHKDLLTQCRWIGIATDDDAPGDILGDEIARRLGRARCWRMRAGGGLKDSNEVWLLLGADGLNEMIEEAKGYPVVGLYSVEEYWDSVEAIYEGGYHSGLRTRISRDLDAIYTVAPGQVTVITGIPNSGKSEFVDAIALSMMTWHEWPIAYWSPENPPQDHLIKLCEKSVEKPFFGDKRMSKEEMNEAMESLNEKISFLADAKDRTVNRIVQLAEDAAMSKGIRGLVVDPYNYIDLQVDRNQTETKAIGDMIVKLHTFATNYDAHVWIVAHPSKLFAKDGKIAPPTGYSISGSANWFNMPDCGLTVWREQTPGDSKIMSWKCRWKWIGKQGEAPLEYDMNCGIYRESNRAECPI